MSEKNNVSFGINKKSLLSILRKAASQERTVVEFRTVDKGEQRSLDSAIDITEHVEALEEQVNE